MRAKVTLERAKISADEQHFKEVLLVAVYAGEIMLRSGGETARVEETTNIILKSFGLEHPNTLVMPTGLYVSAYNEGMALPLTLVRRVTGRQLNFYRFAAVNELSRRIAQGQLTLAEADRELHGIEIAASPYPFWLWVLAGASSSCGVTVLLGGGAIDALAALVSSILVQLLIWLVGRSRIPAIFGEFTGAALATALALLMIQAGLPIHPTLVIAGGIIRLVPGAALLSSVQDGISGDLISSAARGLEAFLKGAAVASGVGLALNIGVALGVPTSFESAESHVWQIPIQVGAAFVASACYAVAAHAPLRAVAGTGLAGAVCWLTYLLLAAPTHNELLETFLAAVVVAGLGWGLARWQHEPVTLYILPGVLPLLPGLTIYNGMLALARNQSVEGLLQLAHATFLGGALAAGVALSNTVAPTLWHKPHLRKRD